MYDVVSQYECTKATHSRFVSMCDVGRGAFEGKVHSEKMYF